MSIRPLPAKAALWLAGDIQVSGTTGLGAPGPTAALDAVHLARVIEKFKFYVYYNFKFSSNSRMQGSDFTNY